MVWLNFPTAYSFVMISPNLYAIWVFLLVNLSQDLKCFLLIYFETLGDGYSLKGSNKKPLRHTNDALILSVAANDKLTFCFFIKTNFFKVNFAIISSACKVQCYFYYKNRSKNHRFVYFIIGKKKKIIEK